MPLEVLKISFMGNMKAASEQPEPAQDPKDDHDSMFQAMYQA